MRRPDSPTLPTSHSYICLSGSSLASSSAIGITLPCPLEPPPTPHSYICLWAVHRHSPQPSLLRVNCSPPYHGGQHHPTLPWGYYPPRTATSAFGQFTGILIAVSAAIASARHLFTPISRRATPPWSHYPPRTATSASWAVHRQSPQPSLLCTMLTPVPFYC